MRAYKNKSSGPIVFTSVALGLVFTVFSFLNFIIPHKALAANNAVGYCSQIISEQVGGGTPAQVQQTNNPAYKYYKACIDAYNPVYTAYRNGAANAQTVWDNACATLIQSNDARVSYCTQGRNQGKVDGQADRNAATTGNTGSAADADIINKAKAASECQAGSAAIKNACIAGYYTGYKGGDKGNICKNGGSVTVNGTRYAVTNSTISNCNNGFTAGAREKSSTDPPVVNTGTPAASTTSADALDACKDYGPKGTQPNHGQTLLDACAHGYDGGLKGDSQSTTCNSYPASSDRRDACVFGFNAGKDAQGDDTTDCVTNGGTGFEWILCPFTSALSKSAEAMNGFIENQLNFSSKEFLPESGNNDGIYKAWSIIKNLVTSVLIILLLVVVISQAVGTGVFEAYTVRKILPRLLIAVVAMQLSWELTKFAVDLANDLGNGVANLISAPFGGAGNLDLNSLLSRLSNSLALATNAGLGAAILASGAIAVSNPAGALLIAFSVILAVLIALATILIRNVIIIACVMLSPLAILLWVLPMKGLQSYWSLWRDNFTKALLLFPIMAAVIYTGRIFAWVVGDLSTPGFIALLMVLVGFFGPYYLLPSMFKRGGSWMSSAYGAIDKGGNVLGKKPKEYFKDRKEEFGKARKLQSQQRVNENRPSFIRGDYFRSGKLDPMYAIGKTGGKLREAKLASYGAGGASSLEEENKHFEQSVEAMEKGLNERTKKVFLDANGNETTDDKQAAKYKDGRKKIVLSGDKDDLAQAIVAKDTTAKFKMVDGKVLTIDQMFGHVSDEHVEAALGRMSALGGSPNLTQLDEVIMGMMSTIDEAERTGNTTPDTIEMNKRLNRFLGRTAGTNFNKMPHWYKGVNGAAGGLSPDQLAGVSGASMQRMLNTLKDDSTGSDPDKKKDATEALAALARTWGEAVDNPNIFARVDKKSRQAMGTFLANMNDPLKESIALSSGDINFQNDTRAVIEKLQTSITPSGDLSTKQGAVQSPQATTQQGTQANAQTNAPTTSNQTQAPSSTGAPTGGSTGAPGAGNGGAPGAGAGTFTGAQAAGEAITKTQMKEAFIEAIENTGLGKSGSDPTVIRVPHNQGPGQVITPTAPTQEPNIPVSGRTESGIYIAGRDTDNK
jgi:hypothetical protein